MRRCKDCKRVLSRRSELPKHYKLKTFLAQLNKYSDQLIHVIQAKGGGTRDKTANIMHILDHVCISPMLTLIEISIYHNLNIM